MAVATTFNCIKTHKKKTNTNWPNGRARTRAKKNLAESGRFRVKYNKLTTPRPGEFFSFKFYYYAKDVID